MPTPQKIYAGSTLIYESPITDLPQVVDRVNTGVTVTASASTNTKGSWTQLIASTSQQTDWLLVSVGFTTTSAGDHSFLVDIGTGTSGSESVKIANVACGYRAQVNDTSLGRPNGPYLFPIRVPSGTRIAARAQSAVASRTGTVFLSTLSGAARSAMPTTLDTIGATTATSRGTNLPTSNTYVQLTASTSQAYQALVVGSAGSGGTFDDETSTFTVAKGVSGSEVELIKFDVRTATAEVMRQLGPGEFTTTYTGHIPSNTRLAVKQSVGRTYRDVILYGVPYA